MLATCPDWLDLLGALVSAILGAGIGAWAAIRTTAKTLTHSSQLFEKELVASASQSRRDLKAQAYSRFLGAFAAFAAYGAQARATGTSKPDRPQAIAELLGAAAAAALLAGPQIRAALESFHHDQLHEHLVKSAVGDHGQWMSRQGEYDNMIRGLTRDMEYELQSPT